MKLWDYIRRKKTYVIAELSANHNGSLNRLLALVRAAKGAGADCVKLQTYTADTMTVDGAGDCFRVQGGLWDGMKLYDLYSKAYTPWEWHEPVKRECAKLSLDFLSTPFDCTAVDFLCSIGTEAFKIASPELVDLPLLRYAASKGKPMLLSCGMARREEISEAVETVRSGGCVRYVLLKCCSEYPAKPENMNLSVLSDMKERFRCPVGLSDHSLGTAAATAAVALGACVVEKHLCLSRSLPGPDSAFSTEPEEFGAMVREIRKTEAVLGEPVYGPSAGERRGLRNRRSLFATEDIAAGEPITERNVRSIRPGQGLPPKYLPDVLGKCARREIAKGTPLTFEMISWEDGDSIPDQSTRNPAQ